MRGDEELQPIADRCCEWFVERFLDCFGIDAEPEPVKAQAEADRLYTVDLSWAGVIWHVRYDDLHKDDDRFAMLDASEERWEDSEDFASTAVGILLHQLAQAQDQCEALNDAIGARLMRELP